MSDLNLRWILSSTFEGFSNGAFLLQLRIIMYSMNKFIIMS